MRCETVFEYIKEHPRTTFRDLMIGLTLDPQIIWNSLRMLQETSLIEAVKISNTKTGWKIQEWTRDA